MPVNVIISLVLVTVLLCICIKNVYDYEVLSKLDNVNFTTGRIIRDVVKRNHFLNMIDAYEYTFMVDKRPFSGRYIVSHKKLKKEGVLDTEQRIKYCKSNPRINCLADVGLSLLPGVMAGTVLGVLLLFILCEFL